MADWEKGLVPVTGDTPGNIDLSKQPVVKNKDGTVSTVRSMSFGENGKEILIPTVAHDGSRILSDSEAIDQYRKSGKHLGIFGSPEAATAYAQKLHADYASGKINTGQQGRGAEWEQNLIPLTSMRPGGTAPINPNGPGTSPSLRDLFGTGSNVLGMGASGAQLGAMLGPIGAATGGLVGGVAGALMPPSDSPTTDLGATAADLLASRFVPGGLNTGRRLARIAATGLAPGLGAFLGSQGDKAAGYTKDTPYGKMAFYSILATGGAILGSLASEASPVAQAASKLKDSTGVDIPLSTAEQTGRFNWTEKMLTTGTKSMGKLGAAQDAAAQSAIEKVIGVPMEKSIDTVMRGKEIQGEAQKVVDDWKRTWKQANATTTSEQVPSSVLGPDGQPLMKTVSTTAAPGKTDWADFEKFYNLSRDERDAFFRVLHADPEAFVKQFLPGREDQTKNLMGFRTLVTVLDKSGKQTEVGQLGQALVTQFLRAPLEIGEAANGKAIAQRIEAGIGSTNGSGAPGMLTIALGQERAEALKAIAEVVKNANPLEKVANTGMSLQKRLGNYGVSKAFFTLASAGALGMAGNHAVPGGTLVLGAVGGAVGLSIPMLVGAMMSKPALGKVLIAASKGDAAATGRIIRTLASAKMADDAEETPTSRLQGLFSK